jgi:hypothetical protein
LMTCSIFRETMSSAEVEVELEVESLKPFKLGVR